MITRAIITDRDISNARLKVRIPLLEGTRNTQNESLTEYSESWASILCIPGMDIEYQIGDIVVVGFEDNDIGRPIVLGYLMLRGQPVPDSKIYGRFKEATVYEKFEAPTNTIIGKTSYQQLFDITDNTNTDSSENGEEPGTPTPTPVTGWVNALDSNNNLVLITEDQIPDDDGENRIIDQSSIYRVSNQYSYLGENSNFNCYAYAINTYDPEYTGQDTNQYPVGRFTQDYDVNINNTRNWANQILKDLTSAINPTIGTDAILDPPPLNKKDVQWTTIIPNVDELADNEHLFAFRVGINNSGNVQDYHFMRYDKNIGWTHKMGGSTSLFILKDGIYPWNITDSDGRSFWPAEMSLTTEFADDDNFNFLTTVMDTSTMLINPNYCYSGTIIYFKYKD